MSVCGISTKGNPEQSEAIRLIMDNQHPIVFITGNAGTGKNFISVAAALELQKDKRYKDILYARDVVQCGENIGYLPGDIDDKVLPFMMPLYDNLRNIETYGKEIKANNAKEKIEILPVFNIRGRSVDNCILIVDECQNMDVTTLKTILTRMGKFTKIVLLGSFDQIDNPQQRKKDRCDFERVIEVLNEFDFVAHVELKKSMRSEYCAIIDKALSGIK